MLNAEAGLVTGLGSALFAAATGLLVKGVGVRVSPVTLNAYRCTVAAVVFVPAWLVVSHSSPPPVAIFWTVLSVVFSIVIGDTAFFFSIRYLGVSKATPIAKSYPIFAVIFALFLLGEPLGGIKLVGVILAIVGTALMSQKPGQKPSMLVADLPSAVPGNHWKGVVLALGTAITWGLGAVVLRYSLGKTDINTTNVLRTVSASMMLWFISSRVDKKSMRSMVMDRKGMILVVATGMSFVGATLLTVLSVSLVGAGTASVYTAAAPLFAVPLGVLLFKEKMGTLALIGCAFAIVGVFCVSLA